MKRKDGRLADKIRPVKVTRNFIPTAEGSVLFEQGDTRLICTASVEEKVPPFLRGTGSGWVTAEYAMIPRATLGRTSRESSVGRVGGRTHEIQRLIGRSLRSVVNLGALGGEITIWLDCDVIQADGGTRCAAITGAFIALRDSLEGLYEAKRIKEMSISENVAAISVGVVDDQMYLDLCYEEDVKAQVDMNVVMTESGKIVEVQGTAEERPFSRQELDNLLDLAKKGVSELVAIQNSVIESA